MRKHSLIKIASVLMALIMALSIVPTFSAEVNKAETAEVIENIVTYATIDEFLCEIENERITIKSYTGNAASVTIPAELDGYRVYGIGDYAFKGNTTLKSLIVCKGVLEIGKSAFENCTSLGYIELQGSASICENAFKNTLYFNNPYNWKNGMLINNPHKNVLLAVKEDTEGVVRVPHTVKIIADGAFANCKKITGVYLFEGKLTKIGSYAFENCENLKGVKIPDSVNLIGSQIFAGCKDVEVYSVAENSFVERALKVPFNLIGRYSVYNEKWDVTLLADDDLDFAIEEVVFTEEEMKSIKENLTSANILKTFKINLFDPYTGTDMPDYEYFTLKAPLEGETYIEIYKNTDETSEYAYKASPWLFNEVKDGYAEFACASDRVIANVDFDDYSTKDKTEYLDISVPEFFGLSSIYYYLRNETNDAQFENNIDAKMSQGDSFIYVRAKLRTNEFFTSTPSNVGVKVKVPTEYEENAVYVYYIDGMKFIPIESVTKDGFVEFIIPQDDFFYHGCAVLGIGEKIPAETTETTEVTEATETTVTTESTSEPVTSTTVITEPSEPVTSATVITEPSEPVITEPSAPVITEPNETVITKPGESVTTESAEDTSSCTSAPVPSDPTETTTSAEVPSSSATEPTEGTTSSEDKTTVPDESETPTKPTTPDEEDLLLGDVNRDGKLNIRDATLIQKHLAKLASLDDEQMIIADITLDKKVNIKDATTIQKKIANLI